ncbi:MAG: electron transfer flavoprotein subunit beta/FixA family protein [Oscillospiraceae bacterium]|nr:electron transfer flavoprotein subunit beta/FixA family protein [Oscillospiraceae bacterium]
MLKILVCVKQVPDVDLVKMDPVTGSLIREGVPSIMNPLDCSALEAAVRVKEQYGGEITAITMGPPAAQSVLRECLSVSADRALLITDYAFRDADTLATSYSIVTAAKMFGEFDLIFCGKETLDGATGQMGSQLAERFDASQITGASLILEVNEEKGFVIAERETEFGLETVEAELPCLFTIEKTNYQPRIPNFRGKKAARFAEIITLSAADIKGLDPNKIGAPGSGTIVPRTFPPEAGNAGVMIDEGDAVRNAARLLDIFRDSGMI